MLGGALPPRPPGNPPAQVPPRELPAAGRRRFAHQGERPDHLWSVLHAQDDSERERAGRPRSREEPRRESRSLPSRPEDGGELPALQPVPFQPFQALPPLGWEEGWQLKAPRPRMMSLEPGGDAKEWLERRCEASLTEQRAELARRFGAFEQSDKHFKDWVQREQDQIQAQLQQLRVATQESQQQQQRLVGNLTAQNQKQDMRLQELEASLASASAQIQGVMSAVSAGALSHGQSGGTGEAAMGAAAVAASAASNLEVLRAGLEREASARVALGAETAEQLKQLSDMVFELSNRQHQQAAMAQQKLQQNVAVEEQQAQRQEARLSSLEPGVQQMREEMEQLRDQQLRCQQEALRRCEEAEEMCRQRLSGVQDAALSAARELWEEHQGVVVECKSSLAALQQILDSKDKIAQQLRSLQQQQREEDKQEFWVQFQMRHEQLHAKLGDAERALGAEQNARVEEQHRFETVLSRLGSALEKAQALWLKDSAKLSEQIHEAKRDFSIEMDGETRGVARRLADGLEVAQRQMDELERKLQGSKAEVGSLCERLENTARAQNSELRDAEGRMMRQVNDVQTIQNGRMQQAAFDLKAELAKQDQVVSAHLRDLRQSQEEAEARWSGELQGLETRTLQKIQDTSEREREKTRQEQGHALESERAARLRNEEAIKEDQVRHLEQMREQVEEAKKELMEDVQNAEERLVKRLEEQVELERAKTREQIEAFIEEERSERLKAETERHLALQKRLQAHEELTLQRHNEHRARMESDLETQRRMLESQQLKDKQDLQKDLQDFVQEQRLMAGKLTEDLRSLGGDCKSLAENFEKHQMATEQRFASETAALAAQLSVASAAQSASLLRSQESLTGQLAEQKQQLQGDVAKVSEELDNMNGEILKLIDDEAAKVKEVQEALQSRLSTLEMAFTARTAALGDSDEKLEAQLTELARAFEEAMDKLRETVASDTGRLLEHFGRVQDDVQAVEAEAIRRCEEMAEAQTEGKMEADQMLGNLQANIGELSAKIEELSSVDAEFQNQFATVQEQLKTHQLAQDELSQNLSQEASRATAAEEGLQRTAEGLAAQLAQQGGEQLAMAERSKELAALMEQGHAEAKASQEAEKTALDTRLQEEQKAAEASREALQDMVSEMSRNAEAQLQQEKDRALEAEQGLREGLAAQASQAAAQAAAQAQAQAAATEESVRLSRGSEELRKQLHEQSEKVEAVQKSCTEAVEKAQVESQKALEAVREETAGALAAAESKEAATLDAKMAEAGSDREEIRQQLEKLQKTDEDFQQALAAEEQRATRAEQALQDQLAEMEKKSSALTETVEAARQQAEKAEAEAAVATESASQVQAKSEAEHKAADQSLEEELQKLKKQSEEEMERLKVQQKEGLEAHAKEHKEALDRLQEQIRKAEDAEKKTLEGAEKAQQEKVAALEKQIQKLEESDKKAAVASTEKEAEEKKQREKELEQSKADLEDIKKRLKEAEANDEMLKRESQSLRELQEKKWEDQQRVTHEIHQRQDATADDIMLLGQKLEELSGLGEAASKSEELVHSCQADVTILQEKLDQELGAVKLRMDGGFVALLQRLEAQRFVRESVDTVADGVSNSFLRLLDKSSEKLKERVDALEKAAGSG